jgi:hypothetical protein
VGGVHTVSHAGDPRRLLVRVEEARGGFHPVTAAVIDAEGQPIGSVHRGGFAAAPVMPDLNSAGISTADLDQAGQDLYALLAGGDLAAAWDDAAVQKVPGIVLDIRPTELRRLPWELAGSTDGGWPFTTTQAPAVRAEVPYSVDPGPLAGPLRVLVVVGDKNDPDLDVEEEVDAIYRGLRRAPCCWHVDVLWAPQTDELNLQYKAIGPHVLHFIGHGTNSSGHPALQLMPTSGEWRLTAGYVVDGLQAPPPRLAVLNACRTADTPDSVGLARGLAETFLKKGTAAVVSMQGDVAGPPATHFAEQLYRKLAAQSPIDRAMSEARHAVRWKPGFAVADWVLPVLELRAHPEAVFPHRHPDPEPLIARHKGFGRVSRLVDRSEARRLFHDKLSSLGPGGSGLLFVTGDRRTGKSEVVRACVVTSALHGDRVVYVSFEERGNVDATGFCEEIAAAAVRWLGEDARALCEDFVSRVRILLAPSTASQGSPATPIESAFQLPARPGASAYAGHPATGMPARPRSASRLDDVMARLRGLLETLADSGGLVLVLDRVAQVLDWAALEGGLLGPVAAGKVSGVRLVVVDRQYDLREQLSLLTDDRVVAVKPFRKHEAAVLVREYCVRSRPDDAVGIQGARWATFRDSMLAWASARLEEPDGDLPLPWLLAAITQYRYEAELAEDQGPS